MSEENSGTTEAGTLALAELVGPDKKFKSVEELAAGKLEADKFIDKLKEEKALAVSELEKAEGSATQDNTVKELIEFIKKGQGESTAEGNQPLSEEELHKKVLEIVEADKTKQTAKSNRERGDSLVLEKFKGDKEAADAFKADRAQKLGLTVEYLDGLSEQSPDAFASIMGLEAPQRTSSQSPTALPNVNMGAVNTGPKHEIDGHKTNAWYQAKMKELGVAAYLKDKSLQVAILKDREALGERFFNS